MTEREFVKKCYESLEKELPESFSLGAIEEKFLTLDTIIEVFKKRCEDLKHHRKGTSYEKSLQLLTNQI